MITLAAPLPRSWDIRLVNRNTEELTEAELAWADLVMTGGMLAQQFYALRVIEIARAASIPATSLPSQSVNVTKPTGPI